MSAFNVVRFRVKPGCEQQFIEFHRSIRPPFNGYLGGDLIETGDRTFCLVGKWRSMGALVAARSDMIGILDEIRELLEDLGDGLGVTDPVAGETVASFRPSSRSSGTNAAPRKAKAKTKSKAAGKKRTAAGKAARARTAPKRSAAGRKKASVKAAPGKRGAAAKVSAMRRTR